MPSSNLPTSDPMALHGAAIAPEEPMSTNRTMGAIKAQPIPSNEQEVKEQVQRLNQDEEQVYQLENMLATSLEHQRRLALITQANRESQEKGKAANGKATQTTENPGKPGIQSNPSSRGDKEEKQGPSTMLTGKHRKTLEEIAGKYLGEYIDKQWVGRQSQQSDSSADLM